MTRSIERRQTTSAACAAFVWIASIIPMIIGCSEGHRSEPVDTLVDIGTHRLHVVVLGEGSPAVVIDGGIGAGSSEYRALQERIARETMVIAYDRAGYGSSDRGPVPRDSETESGELKTLLTELNIPGPYVLVGHSLGGLNVEVYAGRFPGDVAGMVLLDPPPLGWLLGRDYQDLLAMAEQMTDEWQQAADRGSQSSNEQERRQAVFFQMIASEHRTMVDTSAKAAAAIDTFGDIPLVVIASGVPNPRFGDAARDYQRFWIEQSRALAAKSSRGAFVLAEDSTHQLHTEAVDRVTAAIMSVIEEVREGR